MASASTVSAGQQVSVNVVVGAAPTSPADAAQVYLDFDASVIQVVSLTSGAALSQVLQAEFDNSRGRVNYAAGTLEDSVEAPFTLVTVNFRAAAATGQGGTVIDFAPLAPPRQTKVAVDVGKNVTGNLTPVRLVIQ